LMDLLVAASDGTPPADRALRRLTPPVRDSAGLERTSFRNRTMELFVWSGNGVTKAFELHYAIDTQGEWSILWTETGGTTFHRVDASSPSGNSHAARVMVPIEADELPLHDLHAEFVTHSRFIEESIRRIVLIRLSQETRKCRNQS